MKANADQIISGTINYIDSEIMPSLPTAGKWLVGAGVGIVKSRASSFISAITNNDMIKAVGIVDNNGMIDIDLVLENLKTSAKKYGKVTIEVPLTGTLSLSDSDIELIRSYIL